MINIHFYKAFENLIQIRNIKNNNFLHKIHKIHFKD